ncbi:MAG TPA: AAA family ATPase [Blastocatellia bacterium]|nr:AAA family ATPase [Blastocatellia bacterium]
MSKAKIISVINYKGGVGKTTSAYHIGCSLAQHYHKRVLLIDIDPQTNLTFLCADYESWDQFRAERGTIATLYRQFIARCAMKTSSVIWKSPVRLADGGSIANLDLIPCDIELLGDELGLDGSGAPFPAHRPSAWAMEDFLRWRRFLCEAVKQVENEYDYILIDCPPNLYLLTQNALLASDAYLVTTIPDHLSTLGIDTLQGRIKVINTRVAAAQVFLGKSFGLDSVAELGGIVFVKVRESAHGVLNLFEQRMSQIGSDFNGKCFPAYTTEMVGYCEASEQRRPVWACASPNAKNAAATEQYQKITRIFLERFQHNGKINKVGRG